MSAHTDGRSHSFDETCRRSLIFAVILAVVGAGLFMLAPAAGAASVGSAVVFTHSAKSGELGGGRLTLHRVRRRVTWASNGGRSGVVRVKRMHSVLFSPGITSAIGTLHVAGHRGGDEPTFRLSRPRYNASRRIVSYRAKPLNNKRLPGRGARKPPTFGAASLSLLDTPQVSRPLTQTCLTTVANGTGSNLQVTKADQQSSDSWTNQVSVGTVVKPGDSISWASTGGGLDWDHCFTDINLQVGDTTFDVYTVRGANGFSINRCSPSKSTSPFSCQQTTQGQAGWTITGG